MVIKDLLGPVGGPDEELDQREDHVYGRYLVGLLAPKSTPVEAEEQDALGTSEPDDPESGDTDSATAPTSTFFPNSIGMSFLVEPDTKAILIKSEWGRYQRIHSETQVSKKTGGAANVWKRVPMIGEPLTVPLVNGLIKPRQPRADTDPDTIVQGNARKTPRGWVVTLFFVNTSPERDRKKDEAWIFQPTLAVMDAADPTKPIFVQRHDWKLDLTKMDPISREETETLEMLYRHRLEFAVGHGVSVHATQPASDAIRAHRLETTFIPLAEVEQQTPPTPADNPDIDGIVLDMKILAELPKLELLASLRKMKTAYGAWIQREDAKRADPDERLGMMVVAGQPKTTSEYIQATSRVGRSRAGPGLVITLFNWARPRDLSHYETFEHYHETFYKHVEALSVTPFSARALDRGLSGVLVALMRLREERLNENKKAGELQDTDPAMPHVIDRIVARAQNAMQDPAVGVFVRKMLEERREYWLSRVRHQTDHRLGYRGSKEGVVGLLEEAGAGTFDLFTCLNSLRDVEGSVNLVLDPNPTGLRTEK